MYRADAERFPSPRTILNYYRAITYFKSTPSAILPPESLFEEVEELVGLHVRGAPRGFAEDEQTVYLLLRVQALVRGVFRHREVMRAMGGPMGLFDYNALVTALLARYAYAPDGELSALLDRAFAFLAHALRYRSLPEEMMDCKACVFCMCATDHSLAAAAGRLDGNLCTHVVEISDGSEFEPHREEDYTECPSAVALPALIAREPAAKRSRIALSPDDYVNDMIVGKCPAGLSSARERAHREHASEGAPGERPAVDCDNFAVALRRVKRANAKSKLRKNIRAAAEAANVSAKELWGLTAETQVSNFAFVVLRSFQLGMSTREARLASFSACVRKPAERAHYARTCNRVATNTSDAGARANASRCFYHASQPFLYKYHSGYNIEAHRIVWFKHMESLGYSCEMLTEFQLLIQQRIDLRGVAGLEYERTVLAEIADANATDMLVLYWAVVNCYLFGNLFNNGFVRLHHGDDPNLDFPACNGLFVFNGGVGYRHRAGGVLYGRVAGTRDVLGVLAEYDLVLGEI